MVLIKHAFINMPVNREDFVSREEVFADTEISNRFAELVDSLKKTAGADAGYIAPVKSDDFLYFRAIMMHAAERCNIDLKTGAVVGDAKFYTERGDDGDDVWKWNGGSDNRQPYSNQNGDVFPEAELIEAHPGFVGRGLFVNHASDDAEKIRGIIIDAVYDSKFKKVEGLIALDKKAYPELARQIETGYQTGVSMGTQVQASYCTICSNKAIVEADFCSCIRDFKNKLVNGMLCAEVNVGLNPIELSVVTVPADPDARIREVYAMLQKVAGSVEKSNDESLKNDYKHMLDPECFNETINNNLGVEELKKVIASLIRDKDVSGNTDLGEVKVVLAGLKDHIEQIDRSVQDIAQKSGGLQMTDARERAVNRRKMVNAYLQGTEEFTTYPVDPLQDGLRVKDDRQMHADVPAGGYTEDAAVKSRLQRAENRQSRRERVMAYMQGTEEPHPPQQYSPEGTNESVRNNEDRQMKAKDIPDNVDIPLKQKLQRASQNVDGIVARFVHAYDSVGAVDKPNCKWVIANGDDLLFEASAQEIYGDDLDTVAQTVDNSDDPARRTYWQFLASADYGTELIRVVKAEGIENAVLMLKGADALEGPGGMADPMGGNMGGDTGGVNINIDADGDGDEFGEEAEELSSGAEEALGQIAQILEDQGLVEVLGGPESEELGELEGAESELNEIEQGLGDEKMASSSKFLKIAKEAIADANILINATLAKFANTSCEMSGQVNNPVGADTGGDANEMKATSTEGTHAEPTDDTAINDMVTAKRKAARRRLAELATQDRSSLLHNSSTLGDLNHSGSGDRGADITVEGLGEAQDADLAAARSNPTGKQGASNGITKTADDDEGESTEKCVCDGDCGCEDGTCKCGSGCTCSGCDKSASGDLMRSVKADLASDTTKEYEARFVAAWDLAVEMRQKNLIKSDDQLLVQAKKIVALDKAAFDNMKTIVADVNFPTGSIDKTAALHEAPTMPPLGTVESSLSDAQDKTLVPDLSSKLGSLSWS